jgi:hypothetical protein
LRLSTACRTNLGGFRSVTTTIGGSTPIFQIFVHIERRTFITDQHISDKARVVVLGKAVEESFGDRNFDPLGMTVRINDLAFTVVGVMRKAVN